jgi:hypothetical protein
MLDVVPFALVAMVCALGALVATGPRWRRALGLAVSASSVGAPWLLPADHLLVRAILAVFVFGLMMRAIDLQTGAWGVASRVGHALSIVDSRKLVRVAPSVSGRGLALALAWGTVSALCYVLVTRVAPALSGPGHWLVRWAGGLGFVYTVSEGAYALLDAAHRLAGYRTPRLHKHPAAARSVQEFWGRRWNLTVSGWLGETFFRPLARRGRPVAGILVAFLASAIAHAYVWGAAMGLAGAAAMLAYFLVQGAIVGVELAVGVSRWSAAPARVWTVAWMALISPVFTEPLLQVMGV